MRRVKRILTILLVVVVLGVFAVWGVLRSDFFWRWAGGQLVALAQGECHCDVQVGEIKGNLFDGLFFNDIAFATPEEVVIRARSLEIRLSLWSLLELRPVIGRLAILEPRLNIRQEADGEWNIIKILPPPPTYLPLPIRSVRFSQILIQDGSGGITALGGQTQPFQNLDVDTAAILDHPITPRQTFTITKAAGGADTTLGRVSLDGSFSYRENFLEVHFLKIKSGETTLLSLEGEADLKNGGRIKAKGELNLPPAEIRKVWEPWPSTWPAAAKFEVQGNRQHIRLTLAGQVHTTGLEVAGSLGSPAQPQGYDFQGAIKNLTPDLLAVFDKPLGKKLGQLSPLEVTFHLQGSDFAWPPARFSWSLDAGPWQYGPAQGQKATVVLSGDRQRQQLQGTIKSNRGQLSIDVGGSLWAAPAGKFTVQAEALQPGSLGLKVPEGTVLTGKMTGSFTAPGMDALDRLKVTGDLEASGKVGGHPLSKAQASLTWARTRLEVARATVQLGNLTAELKGSLTGDKLDFSHQGRSGSGGHWPVPAQVGGRFSWEGTLTGTLADPQVSLKARGQGLAYDQFAMQAVTLSAQASGWPPARGQLDLQASGVKTPAGAFSQATLRGHGGDKLWNFEGRATGPEGARVEVQGGADLARATASLERAQMHLKNLTVRNLGPVVISLASGFEVKPATFQINQGRASLEARITQQEVSGRLEFSDLDSEWLLPASVPLKGKFRGQATLAGTARQPVIQGDLSLGAGRYQDFVFQSCRTSFAYRDNRLSLDGALKTRDAGPALTWSGQVSLRLALMPFALALDQGDMHILVQGDNVNLALLPALTKQVDQAQGAVRLQAKIEGPINQPRVSGQVSWGAGSIRLRATGATYQVQPGEIRLQGNRLTIPALVLQSEGSTTLTGEFTLAGLRPDEVKARVQLDNFKAIDKLGSQAFLSGAVNLDGRWPNLALKGSLTIPKASFRLSFLNLGTNNVNKDVVLVRQAKPVAPKPASPAKAGTWQEPEVWKNLSVDLNIQAPRNVWINDRAAEIEGSMEVQVKKRPGQELAYAGKVQALHGHVVIVGRRFHVARGVVTLPAQPGAEPVVDARLEYETGEVKLFVVASGPVGTPKIVLGGDPAVSETDWMAYLLYGRPVAALSREEQSATSAAGAFGGLATQMLLKDLLGMAPPLTKGLTISYQHRNDPLYRDDPYQVVINYRINRHFSVQTQVGGRNTGGDGLFNFDF